MARLIILIAIAAIALILWHKITKAKEAEKKKMMLWTITGIALTLIGILAVTGHLNVITAMIAGAVALLPRAAQLLKYLPFLSKLYQQHGPQQAQQGADKHQQSQSAQAQRTMNSDEAREILGLKSGHTKEDIIQAHRRMMQKVHPDRGGSDYLAAQINRAKEVLLG